MSNQMEQQMTDCIEGVTLSFGLPYGIEIEEQNESITPIGRRKSFGYSLRYFNRDYAWLGPKVLIREEAFKILLKKADSFPEFSSVGKRHRFWFRTPRHWERYWELLKLVADLECVCLPTEHSTYRETVGKA
jgi:hypothetical protein